MSAMNLKCRVVLVVAAMAVAAPLCAQERAGRVSLREPKAPVPKDSAPELKSRPLVIRGADPEVPDPSDAAAESPPLTLEYLSRWAADNHPLLRRDRARIESAGG